MVCGYHSSVISLMHRAAMGPVACESKRIAERIILTRSVVE